MKSSKKICIFLIILSVTMPIVQWFVLSLICGYTQLAVVDSFYELVANGIITENRVKDYYDNKHLDIKSSKSVASFFLADSPFLPGYFGYITSLFWLLNALFVFVYLFKTEGKEKIGSSEPRDAPRDKNRGDTQFRVNKR